MHKGWKYIILSLPLLQVLVEPLPLLLYPLHSRTSTYNQYVCWVMGTSGLFLCDLANTATILSLTKDSEVCLSNCTLLLLYINIVYCFYYICVLTSVPV